MTHKEKAELKEETLRDACSQIDAIKDRLITIMSRVGEAGMTRKAASLANIIGRLEQWEHTR